MIKEYDSLRNEINQKIELHNTLLTFTITATVTSLTFALSQNKTILYLIPFCILIPMSMRIVYYRSAMLKLSAYMIVFLEKNLDRLDWETRNAELINMQFNKKKRFSRNYTSSRDYECLILSIVCYVFYAINLMKNREFCILTVLYMLLPLSLVLWEALITKRINAVDKEKQWWIDQWNELKD